MKKQAQIFRAIADPTRRQILSALKEQDLRAGEIVEMFTISGPAVSRHLSILKAADLISERRDGNSIIYKLEPENLALCLSEFMSSVCPLEVFQRQKKRRNKK